MFAEVLVDVLQEAVFPLGDGGGPVLLLLQKLRATLGEQVLSQVVHRVVVETQEGRASLPWTRVLEPGGGGAYTRGLLPRPAPLTRLLLRGHVGREGRVRV